LAVAGVTHTESADAGVPWDGGGPRRRQKEWVAVLRSVRQ
jgi:hypothetical protein